MSVLDKLRALASVQDGDLEAVESEEIEREPEQVEQDIFDSLILERRARAAEEDDPMVVVNVTRGKHGGMDYILRNAHGKELSREPVRRRGQR